MTARSLVRAAVALALGLTPTVASAGPPRSSAHPWTVVVSGVVHEGVPVRCALYDDALTWADRAPVLEVEASAVDGVATCRFEGVPDGPVAVRVSQDLDGDGRVDRGMFRLPQEPWGLTGEAGFGASFAAAAVEPADGPARVSLRATPDVTVLPGAFYGQETGLGVAALGTVSGRAPGAGPDTWPSTLTAAVIGTTERQASIALWPALHLGDRNAWIAEGTFIAEHYPTRFYGVGQGTAATYQAFTRRKLHAEASVHARAVGRLYAGGSWRVVAVGLRDIGPEVDARSGEPVPEPSGKVLLGKGVPGEAGSVVSGPVATVRFDSRDNLQSARRGALLRLDLGGFPRALGSTHAHATARADARGYVPFAGTGTLAGRVLLEARVGDVPFSSMGELGGDEVLRGLFQGRFRDRDLAVAEVEVRSPMLWRLRAVGFGGVGQVGDLSAPRPASPARPTFVAGGGLRFEVDPETHSTVRLDVGGGPDGFGLILNFGEAF